MDILSFVHTVEYHPAKKRNEQAPCTPLWVNPANVTESENRTNRENKMCLHKVPKQAKLINGVGSLWLWSLSLACERKGVGRTCRDEVGAGLLGCWPCSMMWSGQLPTCDYLVGMYQFVCLQLVNFSACDLWTKKSEIKPVLWREKYHKEWEVPEKSSLDIRQGESKCKLDGIVAKQNS